MKSNGLHVGMSREEYDRSPRANWSRLKVLAKSPAHFRHAQMATAQVDTDSMKFGRAAHLAVLEPERFRAECAIWDGGRRAGKEWEAFRAKNEGLELLKDEDYQRCMALQSSVRNHPVAGPYLQNGKHEVSVFWTHETPSILGVDGFSTDCKSRLDFIADGALVDLKTTKDASLEGFARESWRYRYHAQAAFYSDAYFAATGRRLPYVIVAVENFEPYVVQVFDVPESVLKVGRDEYQDLLARLHLCRTTSSWPGYSVTKAELELPHWVTREDDVSGLGLDFEGAAQ